MQPDKENIKKYKNFWQNLAKELQTLGYNVNIIKSLNQTRSKLDVGVQ